MAKPITLPTELNFEQNYFYKKLDFKSNPGTKIIRPLDLKWISYEFFKFAIGIHSLPEPKGDEKGNTCPIQFQIKWN